MGTPFEAQIYGYLLQLPQAHVGSTKGARWPCPVLEFHTGKRSPRVPFTIAVARGTIAGAGVGVNDSIYI